MFKFAKGNDGIMANRTSFQEKKNCTIRVAKTKALISFAVTVKLIWVFVFAYADCWLNYSINTNQLTIKE